MDMEKFVAALEDNEAKVLYMHLTRKLQEMLGSDFDELKAATRAATILDSPDHLTKYEMELIKDGKFIQAIRAHRERTGSGLLEAKNACQAYKDQYKRSEKFSKILEENKPGVRKFHDR